MPPSHPIRQNCVLVHRLPPRLFQEADRNQDQYPLHSMPESARTRCSRGSSSAHPPACPDTCEKGSHLRQPPKRHLQETPDARCIRPCSDGAHLHRSCVSLPGQITFHPETDNLFSVPVLSIRDSCFLLFTSKRGARTLPTAPFCFSAHLFFDSSDSIRPELFRLFTISSEHS